MSNRRRLAFKLLLGLGAPIVVLAILFPVFGNARENARRSSCQSNLKQISLSLMQYRRDADEKFPPAALHFAPPTRLLKNGSWPQTWPAYGWADSVQPYLKSVCLYQCPCETNPTNSQSSPSGSGYLDYWFNANLSASREKSASLIMLGDGEGRYSARYTVKGLPANWRDSPREPSWNGTQSPWFERHLGGANYAFADGHVKWLRPEDAALPEMWKPRD